MSIGEPKPIGAGLSTSAVEVVRYAGDRVALAPDMVALEEPLEIRLTFGSDRQKICLSVTMRTPGHDIELALGMLLTEGVVTSATHVAEVIACGPHYWHGGQNIVEVRLVPEVEVDLARLERRSFTSSSCGVCGKTSIDAVRVEFSRSDTLMQIQPNVIHSLSEKARSAQEAFATTGGIHAAALFTPEGELEMIREDIGRHNAVDKLIGARLIAGSVPIANRILFVSGRAGFELVQKAAVAGIEMMVAVGAPSSLAVSLADEAGITLIGFARGGRFNVYSGADRIKI